MVLFSKSFASASALLLVAGSLGAQAAPATCDLAANKGSLAKAAFTLEQARSAQATPAAAGILTNAVKQLEAAKGEDPTVQALYLGQTLAFWLAQPNMSFAPKRGALGFQQSPEATIQLVPTIDSLFLIVTAAKPNCAELVNAYRGGLPGYLNLVNGAITALNDDKLDSAEFMATQANRLFAGSPYTSMVLGNIAAKRKDAAKAQEFWTTAATLAAHDTIYADVERQVLGNLGSAYLLQANTATGADRATMARKAIDVYTRLLAVPGTTGAFLSSGRTNIQAAQLLAGDTAAFVTSYQPMIANPASYSYQELLSSGANAARANKTADAAKLFSAALQQNAYSRDALFNLAVEELALEENSKVPPIVERLVAIDPANPDSYNLAARAYLSMAKAAHAAKNVPTSALYNDSTLVWYTRGDKLPVAVLFTEFSPMEENVTLAGTVTDRRDKVAESAAEAQNAPAKGAKGKAAPAKKAAAAIAPATVTIKIDALDKTGAVLGTQTITTEALTPGQTANFHVTIAAPNAAAYRYSLVN